MSASVQGPLVVSWLARLCLLAASGAAAAIVLSHRYLPMNDAPSHMATAVIAQKLLGGDQFYSAHYSLPPTAVPYWTTTLGTLALLPFLGPHTAFAAVVAAYVVLVPLSFVLLTRALQPPSYLLATLASLTVFNRWYWRGETNFLLGQPFVLLAFCCLLRARQGRRGGFLAFAVLAMIVYLCHIYALAALLVVAGCAVASELIVRRPARVSLACFSWTLLLFLTATYMVLGAGGGEHKLGSPDLELSVGKLAGLAVGPFESPTFGAFPWVLPFLVAVGALVAWPMVRKGSPAAASTIFDLTALVPALVLLAGAAVGPARIIGPDGDVREAEVAERFILPGVLLLLAAIRMPPSLGPATLCLVVSFGGLKLVDASFLHTRYDGDIRRIHESLLVKVSRHQRLLCLKDLERTSDWQDLYHRVGLYVVVEREAYSPHVFAVPGQQALRHRLARHRPRLSEPDVTPLEWAFYDFVLVQTDRPRPRIPGLEIHGLEVARDQDFRLYALRAF